MVKVQVVDYNDNWVSLFQQEADKLKRMLGDELIEIYHIGSTSVPQLHAKPIIDIMPVVRNIDRIDTYNSQMELIGYECMGEFGIPGRRYFRKGGDKRTHHVHVFEVDDNNVQRHLAFRDYLRTHLDDATRYASLKRDLAEKFPNDIQAYMDGKNALVKDIEKKAVAWYQVREA
ncbi:GrpB family protein [Alicyclobacillus tolerans]|uniref:GrpB family protein n=1 Tax=Alicyclobacillus mengziensis TaxID=2931921 RepID=A0A9X7W3M0_9BACL|nr:GrpB family protein [Alicyclobacillus mengziensis]MCF8566236.1 GrpB family protein [Alicyclobacillus tolerans]QSO50019.1 GrpB family protein [Alicyclobacillus mengziensis]